MIEYCDSICNNYKAVFVLHCFTFNHNICTLLFVYTVIVRGGAQSFINELSASATKVIPMTGVPQINTPPPSYHNIPVVGNNFTSLDGMEPPSYEEAINPNAPPPSYDSLFGRIREAERTSKGVLDFIKNVLIILLGTIGCTIILGVTIVIPICMIVMGAMYLHDCPGGEYIPVYLLVGGIFGILKQLLHLSVRVRKREEERQEEHLRQSPTQTLLNCFMLGWFIIGSVWVYKEYEPNYDPNIDQLNYCNRNLYLFAFWLITSVYILLAFITVCLCSLSIISIVFIGDQLNLR